MASDKLGPRRRALLEAWGEHITTESSGPRFDFSPTNRTNETQTKANEFVQKRDEESFEALWSKDVIADSVFSSTFVLNKYDGNTEKLARTIEDIQQSSGYNAEWEQNFAMKTAVWELYGRLHPETAPVLNSESNRGLEFMGFSRASTHSQATKQWNEFKEAYESVVGHATAGTSHEVALHHEIGEFLWFVANTDEDDLVRILLADQDTYQPITGWHDEKPLQNAIQITGLTRHIEGYITAKEQGGFERDGPDDLWNKGHFESWKDSYLQHMEDVVKPNYDLTNLSSSDIEPLLDDLTESTTLGTPVPSYMLGGASGGILWSEFKKASLADTEETAAVLSYLFDTEEDVSVRLDRFSKF